jgi:long-chain acyl-CoA synthetase
VNAVGAIRRHAAAAPDATALIGLSDERISCALLDRLLDLVGARLLAIGLRPGQVVGLGIDPPEEALGLVVALALARLGIASADPRVPPRHLAALLLQHGTPAPAAGPPVIRYAPDWLAGPPVAPVAEHPGGTALLRVFATSGTTGNPLFCPMSHAMLAARNALPGERLFAPGAANRVIVATPLGAYTGFRHCVATLEAGGTLVFTNIAALPETVLRHRVEGLFVSPRTLQEALARIPEGVGPLPPLRIVKTGGAFVPPRLAARAKAALCPFIATGYAATEIGPVAIGRHGEHPDMPFAAGRIRPGVAVEVVDEAGSALPPGAEGEIRVRTGSMIAGYLDDAEATASRFRDGWFHPGDLGFVNEDGVLCVTGRIAETINAGGEKIAPRRIEAVLEAHPAVEEAAAFGVPDRDGLVQVWAAVGVAAPVPAAELDRLCAAPLGPIAPRFVLQMKALPRNANGKVMTRELVAYGMKHYAGG